MNGDGVDSVVIFVVAVGGRGGGNWPSVFLDTIMAIAAVLLVVVLVSVIVIIINYK